MVQQVPGGNSQQGTYYSPRDNWHRPDRDPYVDEHRLQNVPSVPGHQHAEATTVEAALKHCARIPVRNFALIVLKEDGEEVTFAEKSMAPYLDRIFNWDARKSFRRAIAESERGSPGSAYLSMGPLSEFDVECGSRRKYSNVGSSSDFRQHRKSRSEDSEDGPRHSKRTRRGDPGLSVEDAIMPVPVQGKQQLIIGDSDEVWQYYQTRFRDMQQSACKVMGKAFVRLVEPKKQTHHPYTKGDEKAPPWWPETTGADGVRHKEPDHLLKRERIHLLVHILRMVIEPKETQHPTLKKLGGLDVKALEVATMEAMSNWFADKEHPDNKAKLPYLKEVFKVARAEERYRRRELDGTTGIPITFGERMGDDDSSDGNFSPHFKPEDDEDDIRCASILTPDSLVSPSMGHNHFQHLDNDFRLPARPIHSMRPQPYALHDMGSMGFDDSSVHSMNYCQPSPNNPMDSSRRQGLSPIFSPQHSLQQWSNNMVAASQSPSYTTSPPAIPPSFQLPDPQASVTALNHHVYEPFHTAKYDSRPSPGCQFRTGSIGHAHYPLASAPQAQGGYQDYLSPDHGYVAPQEMKQEQHQSMGHDGLFHPQQ